MPIIDPADEATAREIWQRSGLTPTQFIGSRDSNGEVPDEHDAYRHIARNIMDNVTARVELEAQGLAGGLGFPPSDSTLAEAEPAWDSTQRTEYSSNLLRLLREWAIWLGVVAVRASAVKSASNTGEPDRRMEFAAEQAKDIRDVLAGQLAVIATKTAAGDTAAVGITRGTVTMTRNDGYAQAYGSRYGSEYALENT